MPFLVSAQSKFISFFNYIDTHWKSLAALAYIVICIFDFVVVPTWIGITREPYNTLIPKIEALSPQVQTIIISRPPWEPLTLKGGGMFHLAFGALLTGSALARNETNQTNEINETKETKKDA